MNQLDEAPTYAPMTEDGTDTKFSRIWLNWFIKLRDRLRKWYTEWTDHLALMGGFQVYTQHNYTTLFGPTQTLAINIYCPVVCDVVINGFVHQSWTTTMPTWGLAINIDNDPNIAGQNGLTNWQEWVTLTAGMKALAVGNHLVRLKWTASTSDGFINEAGLNVTVIPVI